MASGDMAPIQVTNGDLVKIFRKTPEDTLKQNVECLALITPCLKPLNDSQMKLLRSNIGQRKSAYKCKQRSMRKPFSYFEIKCRDWLATPMTVKKDWINSKGHHVSENIAQRGARIEKLWNDLSKKRKINKIPIDIYYSPQMASCRAVMMAARAVEMEMNYILVDFTKGDHLTSLYRKLNPQHTVPVMNDNGFILNESQAIMRYLANTYGKDDSLYSIKDTKKRAIVDMRLEFAQRILTPQFFDTFPRLSEEECVLPDSEKVRKWEEVLGWLDAFITDGFAAGYQLTIADFSIMSTLEMLEKYKYDLSKFKNIQNYIETCKKEIPGYESII